MVSPGIDVALSVMVEGGGESWCLKTGDHLFRANKEYRS